LAADSVDQIAYAEILYGHLTSGGGNAGASEQTHRVFAGPSSIATTEAGKELAQPTRFG
jgi:hypothetical protein